MSAPERIFWNMAGNGDAAINYVTEAPSPGAHVHVEYVRADLLAAKVAENAELRAELARLREPQWSRE